MLQREMLRSLQSQSTWRLLGLGIITYGVYYAHYCARQTRILNSGLMEDRRIPAGFIGAILVLSYASLVLFFGYLFVDESHPVAIISNLADKVWIILMLAWGFYARSRINEISGITKHDAQWFDGLWTLLFAPLYFNYKVNVLNESLWGAEAAA